MEARSRGRKETKKKGNKTKHKLISVSESGEAETPKMPWPALDTENVPYVRQAGAAEKKVKVAERKLRGIPFY